MKKNIKLILLIIIFIVLLLLSFKILYKPKEESKNCSIELETIFNNVDDMYINEFTISELDYTNIITSTLDLSDTDEYLFAKSNLDENEYYIIIKDYSKEKIKNLKDFINIQKEHDKEYFKNTQVITKNNYTYFIVSLNKTSKISAIIINSISC